MIFVIFVLENCGIVSSLWNHWIFQKWFLARIASEGCFRSGFAMIWVSVRPLEDFTQTLKQLSIFFQVIEMVGPDMGAVALSIHNCALLWQVPHWRMARMSWFIAWQVPIAQVPQVRCWMSWVGCGMTNEVWWNLKMKIYGTDRYFLNQVIKSSRFLSNFRLHLFDALCSAGCQRSRVSCVSAVLPSLRTLDRPKRRSCCWSEAKRCRPIIDPIADFPVPLLPLTPVLPIVGWREVREGLNSPIWRKNGWR